MTTTLARTLPQSGARSDDASGDHIGDSAAVAGRRGRPGSNRNASRIAIGLLVLVVSVLGTLTLYSNAGDRRTVIALQRDVPAGKTISAADLNEVSISADASVSTVSTSDAGRVVGKVAMVELAAGSLLTANQIGDAPKLSSGEAMVGAVLKAGQYPSGLQVGSTVRVVEVPAADAAGRSDPVSRGVGRVADIRESSNDGNTVVVSLVVSDTSAEAIASAGAAGRVSLVVQGAS